MKGTFVYVVKNRRFPYMDFYLLNRGEITYLFTTPYEKNVYHFFQKGKSINQLREFKYEKKKDKLTKLIKNRIPYELKKKRKEIGNNEKKRKNLYIRREDDRSMEYLA